MLTATTAPGVAGFAFVVDVIAAAGVTGAIAAGFAGSRAGELRPSSHTTVHGLDWQLGVHPEGRFTK